MSSEQLRAHITPFMEHPTCPSSDRVRKRQSRVLPHSPDKADTQNHFGILLRSRQHGFDSHVAIDKGVAKLACGIVAPDKVPKRQQHRVTRFKLLTSDQEILAPVRARVERR